MWLRLCVAVMVLAMLSAGCGEDGTRKDSSSGRGQEYVEALLATTDHSDFTKGEARCLARGWVDVIGVDVLDSITSPEELSEISDLTFTEAGIPLDEAQRDGLWDVMSECTEVRGLIVEGMAAGSNIPRAVLACFERSAPDELLEEILITLMVEGERAFEQNDVLIAEMRDALTACSSAGGSA